MKVCEGRKKTIPLKFGPVEVLKGDPQPIQSVWHINTFVSLVDIYDTWSIPGHVTMVTLQD